MTPTATSVGARCSLLLTGLKRPAGMSPSAGPSGPVDAVGGPMDRAVFADAELCGQERGRECVRIFGALYREPVPLREPLRRLARYRGAIVVPGGHGTVVVAGALEREPEAGGKPAPCGLGPRPRVRSRSSATASRLVGVEGRIPS